MAPDAITSDLAYEYRGTDQDVVDVLHLLSGSSVILSGSWEIEPVLAALRLSALPPGWDGEGGPPPTTGAIAAAIKVIEAMAAFGFAELPAPHVFPVPGGGVELEWRQGNRTLEIVVLDDGSAAFARGLGGEPVEEGTFPPWPQTEAKRLFEWPFAVE